MTQMIENTHENDEVETFPQRTDVVDRHFAELDVETVHVGREARLRQVVVAGVESEDAGRAAPLHLHRVESGIASDVEDRAAGKICWNGVGKAPPFHRGIIAQKMLGRCMHAVEIKVVKPGAQRLYLRLDLMP